MERRNILRAGVFGGTAFTIGAIWPQLLASARSSDGPYGPLLPPDSNGMALPEGFTSRVVATTGRTVPGTAYTWHSAPDGGATFGTSDGGWIYVSNSELSSSGGGAGMVRFDADGQVVDARRILSGTTRNCAGGPTPWGTWLSCEETSTGQVWECDPAGEQDAVVRPAMGRFNHEAAAVDPVNRRIYLTEDQSDGGLYRFTPSTWPDLSSGTLEVMTGSGGDLGWTEVPDPDGSPTPTRRQVASMKVFRGGEGAWYDSGKVYFTTKGDNRVWTYEPGTDRLEVIYDRSTSPDPVLSGVDNVTVAASGDVYVAEDGGNMELVILTPPGEAAPFMRLDVSGSEVTGPAFDPSGTRLYFSSQRNPGRTYEVTGPFRTDDGGGGTTTTTSSTSTTVATTTTTAPAAILLSATGRTRANGRAYVDLSWSGATSERVGIRRDGTVVADRPNNGAWTDRLGRRSGTFTYQVAHPGGDPVSNEVTVTV